MVQFAISTAGIGRKPKAKTVAGIAGSRLGPARGGIVLLAWCAESATPNNALDSLKILFSLVEISSAK